MSPVNYGTELIEHFSVRVIGTSGEGRPTGTVKVETTTDSVLCSTTSSDSEAAEGFPYISVFTCGLTSTQLLPGIYEIHAAFTTPTTDDGYIYTPLTSNATFQLVVATITVTTSSVTLTLTNTTGIGTSTEIYYGDEQGENFAVKVTGTTGKTRPAGKVTVLTASGVKVCTTTTSQQTNAASYVSVFKCNPTTNDELRAGSYTLHAAFTTPTTDDGYTYTAATSGTEPLTVYPNAATHTYISFVTGSTSKSLAYGSETTLGALIRVTVIGTTLGRGYPEGDVTLWTSSDTEVDGVCQLASGSTGTVTSLFSCTLTSDSELLVSGSPYTLHAYYAGGPSSDPNYTYGTSSSLSSASTKTVSLTVTPASATSTTTVAFSTGGSTKSVTYGSEEGAGFTVTVTGTATAHGYPTGGTVTLETASGNVVGTCSRTSQTGTDVSTYACSLDSGTQFTANAAAAYVLHAHYSGGTSSDPDYIYGPSTSTNTVSLTVNARPTPPSLPVVTTTVSPPGAPDLTTAVPGTSSVKLVWTAPSSDGGASITNYRVCYATSATAVSGCASSKTAGTATTVTVTGLINGTKEYFEVKAENQAGFGPLSNTTTATPTPPPPAPAATRVAGTTVDATAAAEFERTFPLTKGVCPASRAAVLATTAEYDDALASQYLAQSLATGTLLTPKKTLAPVTATTLEAEGITKVYVVGGPLAVTQTVLSAIEALTADACGGKTPTGKMTVTRISGTTRYGTAAAIAEHVGTGASLAFPDVYATTSTEGGNGEFNDTAGAGTGAPAGAVPTAILASGTEFQDAQAASVVSYRTKLPLLLTPATSLSTTTVAAIEKLGVKQVILMGGTLAVTNAVETALAKMGVAVLRVAGVDYTDTAVELARFEAAAKTTGLGWTFAKRVLVAHGTGFSDGIAGAVLDSPTNTATGAAGTARPILLTETPTTVGTYLTAFLKTTGTKGIDATAAKTITSLTILGGPLAITTTVVAQMEADLGG